MQDGALISPMLALYFFGGGEIILIFAASLILLGNRHISELSKRLGEAFFRFKDAAREITDNEAFDAGRSVGGIYGSPAAQAITPDNKVAELYDPAVFQKENGSRRPIALLRHWFSFSRRLGIVWRKVLRLLFPKT